MMITCSGYFSMVYHCVMSMSLGMVEHSIREKYDSIYGSKLVTPEPKSLILQ